MNIVLFDQRLRHYGGFVDYLTALGRWTAPTWAIVGGKVVNTPTIVDDEKVANGGFDSDTTSWTPVGANLSSAAGGQAGNRLQLENSGAAVGYAYQNITLVAGTWYAFFTYHKNGTGQGIYALATTSSGGQIFGSTGQNDANWTNKPVAFRAPQASCFIRLVVNSAVAGVTTLFDTATTKPLSFPSLFALRRCSLSTWNMITPLTSTLIAGTQQGIIFCANDAANPTDFAVAYCDGAGNVKIEKKTTASGWSTIATVAAAWANNKFFSAKRSAWDTFSIYYGTAVYGTLIGTVTINDASIIGNQHYGLFATYSGNQFDPTANPFVMSAYTP